MLKIVSQTIKQVSMIDDAYGYELDFANFADLMTDWGSSVYYSGKTISSHCQFYMGPHGTLKLDPRMKKEEFMSLIRYVPFPNISDEDLEIIWNKLLELGKNWLPDIAGIVIRLKWHYRKPSDEKLFLLKEMFDIHSIPDDLSLLTEKPITKPKDLE